MGSPVWRSGVEGGAEAEQEARKALGGADGGGTRTTNLSIFQSRKQEVMCLLIQCNGEHTGRLRCDICKSKEIKNSTRV